MDRSCADAVSGIARRIASSGLRNQHSEIMSESLRASEGSTEQQLGSEYRRPNYAVAAGCPLLPLDRPRRL
jgi:hypothetical protein